MRGRAATMLRGWAMIAAASATCGCAAGQMEGRRADTETAAAPGARIAAAASEEAARLEVGRELDGWHDAAARADEERYFAHFAAGGVFLGTDATERWDVAAFRAYARPHFARGKAWSFRATRREIALADGGAVAWFDEDLATQNLGAARGSGVLVREGGRWKIAQYNLTITVPNERFDEVKQLLQRDGPPAGGAAAP